MKYKKKVKINCSDCENAWGVKINCNLFEINVLVFHSHKPMVICTNFIFICILILSFVSAESRITNNEKIGTSEYCQIKVFLLFIW